jgi:branched-chain amino acid transport system permease protein
MLVLGVGTLVALLLAYWAMTTPVSSLQIVVQILIQGLMTGGLYALMAAGLTIVLGVMKIINLSHGDLMIIGSFTTYWIYTALGLSLLLAALSAFVIGFAIGVVVQVLLLQRALRRGLDQPMLITWGISLVTESVLLFGWGGNLRSVMTQYATDVFTVAFLRISFLSLLSCILAFSIILVLVMFLKRTFFGLAIRAVGQDVEVARLMGVKPLHVNVLAFGIGSALAGIAGVLYAITQSFTPVTGVSLFLLAFIAIVVGGVGSIDGTLVGGLFVGVVQSVLALWLGGEYSAAVLYFFLIVFLMFKPTGLLAKYRAF